jgi:hypothetical protein
MKLNTLRNYAGGNPIGYKDEPRNSFYLKLTDVFLTGKNIHYPNCLLYTGNELINPYDEQVMSLKKNSFYENDEWDLPGQMTFQTLVETPVFFFVYNIDNYYHFIYDSIPILYSYFKLKEEIPTLTILLQTSHPSKQTLPPFGVEFLSALGIHTYEFAQEKTLYKKLYVATSLTHGAHSNSAPSPLAFSVWNRLRVTGQYDLPKRFYISRRSWIHGSTANMGTNYTTRRKCINEDDLVDLLKTYDIQEVFTELLTTDEKLSLFQNAECVVGIIGGGMANLLFSPRDVKSLCITTPYFLEINERFQHSMNHTQIAYSECASHTHQDWTFKPYSRVKVQGTTGPYDGCIGEIEEKHGTSYTLSLSSNDVAGFSQDFAFVKRQFHEDTLVAIDQGLNSPFVVDLVQLEQDLKCLLNMN